jgi:hypothetical protein
LTTVFMTQAEGEVEASEKRERDVAGRENFVKD